MLSVDDILTTCGKYPDRPIKYKPTEEVTSNAEKLATKLNALLKVFAKERVLTSGYRPGAINARIKGAAKASNHMLGRAADIEDTDKKLAKFCLSNLKLLEELELWMEDPGHTKTWVHLQTVPPRSGIRVFKP